MIACNHQMRRTIQGKCQWLFEKIYKFFTPDREDKKIKEMKKSGNSGFVEFPRLLHC